MPLLLGDSVSRSRRTLRHTFGACALLAATPGPVRTGAEWPAYTISGSLCIGTPPTVPLHSRSVCCCRRYLTLGAARLSTSSLAEILFPGPHQTSRPRRECVPRQRDGGTARLNRHQRRHDM
ncbi:MAG: hypothetical protein AVDCRST_MAG26-1382 [uncultured Chloroflexia bacterium]|uniref:Uncharacterized protein n=1 Tax=uncultured Chloroflexia bacterium TaxID=1672391 RepID=A0A6J4I486_9CHLR|nr:MAG: hypothetical protein AVDCRST_MAG26-1382 [uncultured Chloroflexia bacterium]